MALNGLFCADVPLRNYSLAHSLVSSGRVCIACAGQLYMINKLSYLHLTPFGWSFQ